MQTMEQLLSKVLDLLDEAKQRGENPDLLFLTPDDEHTLAVHAWLKAEAADKDALRKQPPDVREMQGYRKLAGLTVEWDATTTSVRARTTEEQQVERDKSARAANAAREVSERLSEARRKRLKGWGGY